MFVAGDPVQFDRAVATVTVLLILAVLATPIISAFFKYMLTLFLLGFCLIAKEMEQGVTNLCNKSALTDSKIQVGSDSFSSFVFTSL